MSAKNDEDDGFCYQMFSGDGGSAPEDKAQKVKKEEDRITKPVMTKYERTKLLAVRTKQLSLGAKPMIKNTKGKTYSEIAGFEISNKTIPLIVRRPLPGGAVEEWKVSELTELD